MRQRFVCKFVAVVAFFLIGTIVSYAQNEYEYEIAFKDSKSSNTDTTKVKEIYKKVTVGHWSSAEKAVELANRLKKLRDNDFATNDELKSIIKKEGGRTVSKGKFSFEGMNSTCVIILDEDSHIFFVKHRDGNNRWEGITVSESPDKEFNVTTKSLGGNKYGYKVVVEILSKEGTTVTGEYKGGGDNGYNFDYEDGYERFEVKLTQIPANIREDMSRIIILPYAIDCQTDDTISYLAPAVYEGEDYHGLQDKRKSFDYAYVDSLGKSRTMSTKLFVRSDTVFKDTVEIRARKDKNNKTIVIGTDKDGNDVYAQDTFYVHSIVRINTVERDTVMYKPGYIKPIRRLEHTKDHILIDTVITFRKPDKKKSYRGMIRYSMEDYHHTFFDKIYPGTCLHVKPFKFLEVKTSVADIPLTDEFYQKPEEGRVNIPPKDLGMFFEHGTTKLIEDSAYHVTINQIYADFRDITSSGGELTKGSLTAYASPDGSEATNRRLAEGRAQVARSKIMAYGSLKNVETHTEIDTWDHTAEMLEKEGLTEEAAFVRECIASSNGQREVAWRKIATHPQYREIIKPVVDRQCRITFTYEYFAQKVMNAQEAAAAYRANKHKMYSNGDYYNMFTEIEDSVELDELTEIAYNRVIVQNGDEDCLFAPFIVNRMALLKIRRGEPDSTILKPLINEGSKIFRFNDTKSGSDILYNRPEIILNQAVTFYMLNEPLRAKGLITKLKREHPDLKGVQDLVHFINFKDLVKIPEESRSAQQKQEFKEALTLIENAAIDNKAVLYTEFPNLKKRDTEAWDYVHLMDDRNPRKWYLMGLLWATRDGREQSEYPLPDEDEDSIDYGDSNIDVLGIPYYMAYFWKSFDLDKSPDKAMMKYYFNEGYINEEMRKKRLHAYKNDRIPAYKKLFRLRKIEDDKFRAKVLEKMNGNGDEDSEDDSNDDEKESETGE